MADYKAIKGHNIETVAGDPSVLQVGDIWYSNTTKKIRGAKLGAGAWSTGGVTNAGRRNYGCTQGTQTATLFAGGYNPGGIQALSEEYDGSSWTEGSNLNTACTDAFAFGTQTAGTQAGGGPALTKNEEYNGTSWTEVTDIPAGVHQGGAVGTQTAGLIFGGSTAVVRTKEYDGTNWTDGGDLNVGRHGGGACGTQTAANYVNGNPPNMTNNEEYDGSTWTEVNNANTARYNLASGGTQTSGIIMGGDPTAADGDETEQYDGTSWTETTDLNTARYLVSGAGASGTVAILVNGYNSSTAETTATEEWDQAVAASSFTSS